MNSYKKVQMLFVYIKVLYNKIVGMKEYKSSLVLEQLYSVNVQLNNYVLK